MIIASTVHLLATGTHIFIVHGLGTGLCSYNTAQDAQEAALLYIEKLAGQLQYEIGKLRMRNGQ